MSTSVITAPTASPTVHRPPRLQVLTLVVAGAAAAMAVFAIATDDVGAAPGSPADATVSQPAAPQRVLPLVAVNPNLDACGRPILPGRLACR
jgi:hypothetical protein